MLTAQSTWGYGHLQGVARSPGQQRWGYGRPAVAAQPQPSQSGWQALLQPGGSLLGPQSGLVAVQGACPDPAAAPRRSGRLWLAASGTGTRGPHPSLPASHLCWLLRQLPQKLPQGLPGLLHCLEAGFWSCLGLESSRAETPGFHPLLPASHLCWFLRPLLKSSRAQAPGFHRLLPASHLSWFLRPLLKSSRAETTGFLPASHVT